MPSWCYLAQGDGFQESPHHSDAGALQVYVCCEVQQQRQEKHADAQHQKEERLRSKVTPKLGR